MTDLTKAMEEIDALNKSHGINVQGGKKYTQVVHRMEVFRKHFGLEYGLDTQVSEFMGGAMVKAYITKGTDVIGAGHAFMDGIGGKKNLEKLESTAVGRALSSIGLSGGEYASANEMEDYEERYEKREFSFKKEKLDEMMEHFKMCGDLERLNELKAICTKEKPNMTPNHIAQVTKAINEKQTELTNDELDSQMKDKM